MTARRRVPPDVAAALIGDNDLTDADVARLTSRNARKVRLSRARDHSNPPAVMWHRLTAWVRAASSHHYQETP